jgi:Peptidoglycan-synthase activator LpoB
MTKRSRPPLPLALLGLAALAALVRLAPASPLAAQTPPPEAVEPAAAAADETVEPATLAVLPLGLADQVRRQFPELAGRGTGAAVHALLARSLEASGRFRLLAARPEVEEDLLNRGWVASTGSVDVESARRYGELLGARYAVFGEVYEFATRRLKRHTAETAVAVQLRLVDVASGVTVSAAATGTASRKGEVFPLGAGPDFTASSLGAATEAALAEAVYQLLARLPDLASG